MVEENSDNVTVPPFLAWRRRLGLTRGEAARLLDRTERQLQVYEQARELPRVVVLAMTALEYLPIWRLAPLGINPTWRQRKS